MANSILKPVCTKGADSEDFVILNWKKEGRLLEQEDPKFTNPYTNMSHFEDYWFVSSNCDYLVREVIPVTTPWREVVSNAKIFMIGKIFWILEDTQPPAGGGGSTGTYQTYSVQTTTEVTYDRMTVILLEMDGVKEYKIILPGTNTCNNLVDRLRSLGVSVVHDPQAHLR